MDAACPWSPWLFDKKDSKVQKTRTYVPNRERDNLRQDTKIRMRSVNYKRPQPLDPDFPEPEKFCLRRRHFRVTRRNRSIRPYLERNPDMAPPDIPEEQPLDQDSFREKKNFIVVVVILHLHLFYRFYRTFYTEVPITITCQTCCGQCSIVWRRH